MNILSKSYRGPFYVIAFVISIVVTVLTSDQIADLGLPWVGPVVQGLSVLLLLVQQFTPIGDGGSE
jgi:hypothetical protein